ncbi:MAG: hypothetical protein HRT40_00145 [Campylobacteraceae bacterium]|nr:hypothetical protein [Campylobacteraceae bacterium]
MKKLGLSLLSIIVALGITGCGSSMYNYKVEPTPIKQESSKYVIKDISLKLSHGTGRNLENKTFKNEDELKKSFVSFLNKELKEQSLIGDNKSFQISINMNYTRTYNYGGNALNKPEFFYTVKVYNLENTLLADFTIPKSTTKYGTFKDIAVNAEISIFKWDAEDEPQDIALISKTLIKELSQLGN